MSHIQLSRAEGELQPSTVAARIVQMRQQALFSDGEDLRRRLGFERKWQNDVLAEALTVGTGEPGQPIRNYYRVTGGRDDHHNNNNNRPQGLTLTLGEEEKGDRGCLYCLKLSGMLILGLVLLPFVLLAAIMYGALWWLPRRCCYMAGGIEDAVAGRREKAEWEL